MIILVHYNYELKNENLLFISSSDKRIENSKFRIMDISLIILLNLNSLYCNICVSLMPHTHNEKSDIAIDESVGAV